MNYSQLNISSKKSPKRVGRGIAAGQGKTAGRGTKGQKARAGFGQSPGFEGGQTALAQRFPKLRGFKSHRVQAENVYTGVLDTLGATINNQTLADAGLVTSAYVRVKLIVKGDVAKKHAITLQAASKTAIEHVTKAGGSFTKVEQVKRPTTKKATSTDK